MIDPTTSAILIKNPIKKTASFEDAMKMTKLSILNDF